MMLAAPAIVKFVTPELSKVNPVDVVVIPVRIVGFVWNTNLSRPVVSVIKPRNCVDVVDANDANVSDVNATLPPCLKFTLIEALALSDVKSRSLSTSKVLLVAISKVADAVEAISSPLTDVAVAAPRTGAVNVGAVRVLFVRTCVSPSVTNLFSTEPSHDLQSVSYTHLRAHET